MKIRNMVSTSGNIIANQFRLNTPEGEFFQSYESMIVKIGNDGKVELDQTYWNYSKTTSKYRNLFLNETTKETQAKIDSGEYTLVNLN